MSLQFGCTIVNEGSAWNCPLTSIVTKFKQCFFFSIHFFFFFFDRFPFHHLNNSYCDRCWIYRIHYLSPCVNNESCDRWKKPKSFWHFIPFGCMKREETFQRNSSIELCRSWAGVGVIESIVCVLLTMMKCFTKTIKSVREMIMKCVGSREGEHHPNNRLKNSLWWWPVERLAK